MKLLSTLLMLVIMFAACSSSKQDSPNENEQKEYANLTKLSPPDTSEQTSSNVHVDSVNIVDEGLLISGNLPDGCSKLHKASHTMQNDSLSITLTAWKPANKMCTQVLTPFSFIYKKLSQEQLKNADVITVNKKEYEINP